MVDTNKINSLKLAITSSKIPGDRKDFLIDFIDSTLAGKISDAEKARKINIAVSALDAYVNESELSSWRKILADSFSITVAEISKPFKNAFDTLEFLTRPYVLIPLILIAAYLVIRYFFAGTGVPKDG
jgi:hypothetical protein